MAPLISFVVLATAFAVGAPAQTAEYALKGELLVRFADFVEFPDDAFEASDSPLVIGVFGEDPFGTVLEDTVRERRVNDRSIIIARFSNLDELMAFGAPQVLFIPASERDSYEAIFELIEGQPVLTVGEEPSFARNRGLVNLLITDNRPQLEIANERADARRLTISSQLLRISVLIAGQGQR